MDPVVAVAHLGGLADVVALRKAGCSEYSLTCAVRDGDLLRIRRGWYSTLSPHDPRVVAVRCGGVLTGASALHHLGAWMLDPPTRIHVAVPAHATRRRAESPVCLHWEDAHDPMSRPGVASLSDSLVRAVLDEPTEVSVTALDWALHTGRLDRVDFERILLRLPRAVRPIRDWVDPASQSILESIARVRLRARGWRVHSQVRVGLLGAIDLVIENEVALELDGREFHESSFESDRRKDLTIAIEGRHAIRASMSMVRHAWPDVERAILAALAARGVGNAGKRGELPVPPQRKLRARVESARLTAITPSTQTRPRE